MAIKTISLELDAYEKLRAAKQSSRESFSEVVRRGVWEKVASSSTILTLLAERAARGDLLSDEELDYLDNTYLTTRTFNLPPTQFPVDE